MTNKTSTERRRNDNRGTLGGGISMTNTAPSEDASINKAHSETALCQIMHSLMRHRKDIRSAVRQGIAVKSKAASEEALRRPTTSYQTRHHYVKQGALR